MTYQTALIVDDSKLARITLKKKLEQRGLSVEMAESGVLALELLTNQSVDIVFMDHLMPELDGFETTKKIKANSNTAHIPVIMCTGKEYEGYLEEARSIGATNILPKPPENDALDLILASSPADAPAADTASSVSTPATPAVSQSAQGLSESDVEAIVARIVNDSVKATISTEMGQHQELSDNQAKKLEQLSTDLTARINALDGALQILESKAEDQNKQPASSAPNQDEVQSLVKALVASEVAEVAPSQFASLLDANKSDDSASSDQLKGTQETVDRLTVQMVDMDTRLDELSNKMSGLSEKVSQVESNAVQTSVAEPVDTSVSDSLSEEVASLKQQLESLQSIQEASPSNEGGSQLQIDKLREEFKADLDAKFNEQSISAQPDEVNAPTLAAIDELKSSLAGLESTMEERFASRASMASDDSIPTLQPEESADPDLNFDTQTDLQHQLLGSNNELKSSLGKMKVMAGGGMLLAVASLVMQFL